MFRLKWNDEARAELSVIWYSAQTSDNDLLVWAANDLMFRLERDPNNFGESRPNNMRIAFSWPLAIWFEVVDETVWIDHIWRYHTL